MLGETFAENGGPHKSIFLFSDIFVQCLGELSIGDAFGELAFQNSTRTATIVCKTACEFLKIDTEDFNQVKFV